MADTLDARGLRCPLPVLKMEKRLEQLPAGATLVVLATDPIAKVDIPLYCTQHGHAWTTSSEGDTLRFAMGDVAVSIVPTREHDRGFFGCPRGGSEVPYYCLPTNK